MSNCSKRSRSASRGGGCAGRATPAGHGRWPAMIGDKVGRPGDRPPTVRVLICDELAVVREGLRTLLDPEPDLEVVGTTDSGIHAVMLAQSERPAVVVTGMSLRGMTGLQLTRRLRQLRGRRPSVVVFVMSDDDDVVPDVLHAGACGVLVRNTGREDLAAAIRAAAKGQAMLAPSVAQRLVGWFLRWDTEPEDSLRQVAGALSPRE